MSLPAIPHIKSRVPTKPVLIFRDGLWFVFTNSSEGYGRIVKCRTWVDNQNWLMKRKTK